MRKRWRFASLAIFMSLLLLGTLTINSIYNVQQHGRLINYAGIVRGATQRVIKLELNQQPSDELLNNVDSILENLVTGEGEHNLYLPDDANYQYVLNIQYEDWQSLKELIYEYRDNYQLKDKLLKESEDYFIKADNTVFAAETYSENHTSDLMYLIIIMFVCVIILSLLLILYNFKRISHLEGSNRFLKDKAGRDTLTGIYSIERFEKVAQNLLDTKKLKYAIFYVDFADFKYINDVFGYALGDELLANYAKILSADINKEYEVVGRVNADNFIILRAYEKRSSLIERQKKADELITEFMRKSLEKQTLSICCGICCVEDVQEELKISEFINRANFARKAVKNGDSQEYYRFYDDSIRQQLFTEKAIEGSIEEAFKNNELEVYYQPKVNASTHQIAGAEALIRWRRVDGSFLLPDVFIPVFEKNRKIAMLDQFVFEQTCIWLKSLIDNNLEPLPISVNVSRLQFYNADFVETYVAIKNRYGIPDGVIEIEFTESLMFENWKQLYGIVDDLQKAGFTTAIDDFGKGYSSLSMFKNLDIDVLKIDALFFKNIETIKKDQELVESIITMAHHFNIITVAEGIESKSQAAVLCKLGCDLIQGYAFYRPMPPSDLQHLITNGNG